MTGSSSPRTFARRFLASTGTTPYQWILRKRIRLAQRLLETGDLPIDTVARKNGLRTASNLRKQLRPGTAHHPAGLPARLPAPGRPAHHGPGRS